MGDTVQLERFQNSDQRDQDVAALFPVPIGAEDNHLCEPVITNDDLTKQIKEFWECLALRLESY